MGGKRKRWETKGGIDGLLGKGWGVDEGGEVGGWVRGWG